MGQAPRRLQQLHHLLKRQVLMGLGRQGLPLGPGDQLTHAHGVGIDPQRQGVDEKADQPLQFRAGAVGAGATDHHLCLTRKPAQ